MAAGPAGGGTEQAFELARNFTSYSRVSVARGARGQTRPCGCLCLFFRVHRSLARQQYWGATFCALIPLGTAAPGCLKAGVPKNGKAQYPSQAFRFFQNSSNHPDSEPDRGPEALL